MSAYDAWCALVPCVEVTEHVVERPLRETQISLHVRPARAQLVNASNSSAELGEIAALEGSVRGSGVTGRVGG